MRPLFLRPFSFSNKYLKFSISLLEKFLLVIFSILSYSLFNRKHKICAKWSEYPKFTTSVELLLHCLFIIMTSIRELIFLVTLVGNATVLIKLYDNNTLCKSCSYTLSCRKFIFQSPHNINFFLFNWFLPLSVSNLFKKPYTSVCADL